MSTDFYSDLDLHSNKISDLADGDAPTDAVNKRQMDAIAAIVPRITVSQTAPANPRLLDLWVDLND